MIASLRGVAIAAVIAVALVIAVVVDLARAPAPVDRALVPGFDPDRVTELVWERAGRPAIRVVRVPDGWTLGPLRADPAAVGEVLAALRGARWHRRAAAGPVHATLTVVGKDGRRRVGLGEPLAGSEQAWIVEGDRGVVVDRWVTRALDRDRLSLREHQPLGDVRAADAISITGDGLDVRLAGRPRALDGTLAAAARVDELERALAGIELVRVPDDAVRAAGVAITDAAASIVVGGSCPGAPALVALSGNRGDGCIEPAAVAAVVAAAQRLQQPAAEIAEPRPIPFAPSRIVLTDGVALDVAARRAGDDPVDPRKLAELVAALTAPAEVVALPRKPAVAHLVVSDRGRGEIALDVYADHQVARRGEPIALRLAPARWDALRRPARELRELSLWAEDPMTISELAIDGVRYQRGQVIGAWTRQPAGRDDPHSVDALVGALAAPRPEAAPAGGFTAAHRVTLTAAPPVGAATQRSLELGALRAAGCPARAGRDVVMLPAMVCLLVAALVQ